MKYKQNCTVLTHFNSFLWFYLYSVSVFLLYFITENMYLKLCVVIFAMLAINKVEASHGFDFGDFLALVLGIAITAIGVLACLGNYARKKARNEFI